MKQKEYETANHQKSWVTTSTTQVLAILDSDKNTGLCKQEVKLRQEAYGKNEFDKAKKESLIEKILHHLLEITSLILLFAAGIAAYMAIVAGEGWMKVFVILAIVVLNITIGIFQENSAERALEALQTMSGSLTDVLRNGTKQSTSTHDLVPGDILLLSAGDIVPADARILECSNMEVDEAFLTGESVPVEKQADTLTGENIDLGDQSNMLFSGAPITRGTCVAVVCAIGMQTEMGAIAALLNNTKKATTLLQKRLSALAKRLSVVALIAGIVIFALKIFVVGDTFIESLMVAVSLAVAAVPETLPVIVTITLAFGVQILVKKNAIIRRVSAVETIGNVSVICSDKTGTLTQNKMTVTDFWTDREPVKELSEALHLQSDADTIATLMSLSNNAAISELDAKAVEVGDPTELALVRFALSHSITKEDIERKFPRLAEHPFDSSRKMMSTIHQVDDKFLLITKGAFDRFPCHFTAELEQQALQKHDEFAANALRVLAVGYKWLSEMPQELNWEMLEQNMTFLGLVGMIDPPRPEAKTSVSLAKKAGIRTVMITGDHLETARAIAKDIGIFEERDIALTGAQLHLMEQTEFEQNIRKYSVYARVSPEDKIRIVKAWQKAGEVVVMTGDGVNDAPALKAADVGAAMGITGTDVSKNTADIILTDDNFATIVDAVAVGRRVYSNILKTVYFLLSVNFAQIFIMLFAVILGWNVPLVAVQLLLINVVADGIPGFYLSREKADPDIMMRKPNKPEDSLFANKMGHKIAFQSFLFIIVTLSGFAIGRFMEIGTGGASYETGMTMAFLILAIASILNIFNVRSTRPFFTIPLKENTALAVSSLLSICVIIAIAHVPFLQAMFFVIPINGGYWGIALLLSVLPLVIQTVIKMICAKI